MARRVRPVLLVLSATLCLEGCGFFGRAERPVWRAQAENACFARRLVIPSDFIVPAQEIDGPGICGMTRPLKVSALANGAIAVDTTLTIDCPMIPALEAWLNDIVQPAAILRVRNFQDSRISKSLIHGWDAAFALPSVRVEVRMRDFS